MSLLNQLAVKWYERSKITGLRYKKVDGDNKIVTDSNAPVMWARFYDNLIVGIDTFIIGNC